MSKRILPILILIGTILLASCEGWTHPPTEISTPSWMWGDWVEPRLVDDDSSLDALYDEIIVSADDIMLWHSRHQEVKLEFFWDKETDTPLTVIDETLSFHTLDDTEFLRQMAGCMAYASTAGFESVCEAIYLEKPVLMVPSHIEQECNAFDAMKSGAGVSADKFDLSLLLDFTKGFIPDKEFGQWARSAEAVIINELEIHYKDSDILVNKIKRKFEK